MPELKHVLASATTLLSEAGVPSPSADANILVAHALGVERRDLARRVILGYELKPDETTQVAELLDRRSQRVPLQHLIGSTGFRRLELLVGPGVFIPRVETEWVAGLAVDAASALEDPLVVDLCTGSGAIALAVADEVPAARVVAVELDPPAVEWARRNIAALGSRVDLRAGDAVRADEHLLADLVGLVDVVVANPPYIPPDAEPTEPEVRDHDPVLALYGGGDDGLAVPRGVVATAARLLRPGGLLVMEHADVQGPGGRALTKAPDWVDVSTQRDLTGRDRALVARRSG
ncbi:peptide chain release factor N(5)-glutamine methyltransferase [Kineosporia sp. NBRC 101731]|uniref:peptide chain release factor N(5)-glutamine methyltransferase n=1 Tax=Kineosporia sp. NBRC 101731 TaxID=3032199 RepID=UPI0024A2A2BA|nr:peptide chain release factor N(5)-glutamine methyltransferase [Kineosporia sp. NBRC 101731]GLY28003.1 protein-(glutamine-N5) methyltransferase, release factor-specific [Kineosporia sp. NBRC 101731]